jgi:hypothetical protein
MTIRYIFVYAQPMSFGFPILERKQFVVTCDPANGADRMSQQV